MNLLYSRNIYVNIVIKYEMRYQLTIQKVYLKGIFLFGNQFEFDIRILKYLLI